MLPRGQKFGVTGSVAKSEPVLKERPSIGRQNLFLFRGIVHGLGICRIPTHRLRSTYLHTGSPQKIEMQVKKIKMLLSV